MDNESVLSLTLFVCAFILGLTILPVYRSDDRYMKNVVIGVQGTSIMTTVAVLFLSHNRSILDRIIKIFV